MNRNTHPQNSLLLAFWTALINRGVPLTVIWASVFVVFLPCSTVGKSCLPNSKGIHNPSHGLLLLFSTQKQMGHRKEAPNTAILIYWKHGAIWISNFWAGMRLPAGVFGNVLWKIQTRGRCLWILLGRGYRSVLPQQVILALIFIVLADSPDQLDLCHSFQSSRTLSLIQE